MVRLGFSIGKGEARPVWAVHSVRLPGVTGAIGSGGQTTQERGVHAASLSLGGKALEVLKPSVG